VQDRNNSWMDSHCVNKTNIYMICYELALSIQRCNVNKRRLFGHFVIQYTAYEHIQSGCRILHVRTKSVCSILNMRCKSVISLLLTTAKRVSSFPPTIIVFLLLLLLRLCIKSFLRIRYQKKRFVQVFQLFAN